MYTKFIVAVLLLSVVHQGYANTQSSTNSIGFSSDVLGTVTSHVDIISYFGSATGLNRGVAHCKELLMSIEAYARDIMWTISDLKTDAYDAYTEYKECSSKGNDESIKKCRQKVWDTFIINFKVRSQTIYFDLEYAMSFASGLPFCLFGKDPY